MELLQVILLGIIQGITEWFPISSSGHLVIAQHFFGITEVIELDLMLHLGSLLVVIWIFSKDIIKIFKAFQKKDKKYMNLGYMIVLGSIPTAIIGLLMQSYIEAAFTNLFAVGIGLIFTSILLYLTHYYSKNKKSFKKISYLDALIVGVFQGIAIFPGISRSGSTISSALLRGIKRDEAARFSFLLFIPAMIGAFLVQLPKVALSFNPEILVGTTVSMVVSYFAIQELLKLIHEKKFYLFSIYCLIVGIGAIIISVV